jgi:hypothetical protein
MVHFFVHIFFNLRRKAGLDVQDASYTNALEQIKNRKDGKEPLIIKTHLPFKLLPREITSQVKKPKVNEHSFLTSKHHFFSLDNLHNTQCQRHLRILLSFH